ncbi:MAG: hypothetical protein RQ754_14160 [Desulfuromonadales bacterium]|nr:hypothetical protein [Desulfuromonadales bacterium]
MFLRYCDEIGVDDFSVTDWYAYHAKNRGAAKYGKTWRDHFATIDYILKKDGRLDYGHLVTLSKDRGSNGNGCLALAYPIVKVFGRRAYEVAEVVSAGTHYQALLTMTLAIDFFLGDKSLDDVICEALPADVEDGWGLSPLAPACLWAAAMVAKERTLDDVVRIALLQGGDVDT